MIRFIAMLALALLFDARLSIGADLELARKEGEVVLYTTMVVSDFQVFQKALATKYPFLKINHVRLGASTLVARAAAEPSIVSPRRASIRCSTISPAVQ